jgi:hypothetical protein
MNTANTGQDRDAQIELARKLLKTVRHAAYATVNEDNTPHNSPLMLIYNEDLTKLYVGSYSESQHCKNFIRNGTAYVVLFDSFTKGQGGVYITGANAHECVGDELVEALGVHNTFRAKHGSQPIDIGYYQTAKPSQRMYSMDIAKIEIYSVICGNDGLITREARIEVNTETLLEGIQ